MFFRIVCVDVCDLYELDKSEGHLLPGYIVNIDETLTHVECREATLAPFRLFILESVNQFKVACNDIFSKAQTREANMHTRMRKPE